MSDDKEIYEAEDCPCGMSVKCGKCGDWHSHNDFTKDPDGNICDWCGGE